MLLGYEGDIDLKQVETLFLQSTISGFSRIPETVPRAEPGPSVHVGRLRGHPGALCQDRAWSCSQTAVPLSIIHLIAHINHKALEKMSRSLTLIRKSHVLKVEMTVTFGGAPRAWRDVG